MKTQSLLILFCLIFHHVQTGDANDDGYLTIIGSKLIRPNVPYKISINAQNLKASDLVISVEGTSSTGQSYLNHKNVSLSGTDSQSLSLELDDILSGNYKLKAKSSSGISFDKSGDLDLNLKKFSIFVQTDKPIYKPGDKIRFRVLFLDSHTRPYAAEKVKIHFTDGKKNRIKQFNDIKVSKGVYQDELQLSDSPVLGNWKINVEVDGETKSQKFEVAKYVLPKFDVSVETEPYLTLKDEKIVATIRAKYTYGSPVKGQAVVNAYVKNAKNYDWNRSYKNSITKTVFVDGKATVEFLMGDELTVSKHFNPTVVLDVSFTDEFSKTVRNATSEVRIYKRNVKIEIEKKSEKFKPGLQFRYNVKVNYRDGSPVLDKNNKVDVDLLFDGVLNSSNSHNLNEYGVVPLNTIIPNGVNKTSITVSYLGSFTNLNVEAEVSEKDQYLKAYVVKDINSINDDVEVEVFATENMSKLYYNVLGRGVLLQSESFEISNESTTTFKFKGTFDMIPKADLLVYYIRSDGELISDKVEVKFSNQLLNFLNLEMSAFSSKPSENITIGIQSNPNSYIGLLGVDQSINLLGKGNDIEADAVFELLDKFKNETPKPKKQEQRQFPSRGRRIFKRDVREVDDYSRPIYKWEELPDTYPNFDSSAVLVLTNARDVRHRKKVLVGYEKKQVEDYYDLLSTRTYDSDEASISLYSASASASAQVTGLSGRVSNRWSSGHKKIGGSYNNQLRGFGYMPPTTRFPARNQIHDEINEPITRKTFPETWLFDSIDDLGPNGYHQLSKQVPDTITSWRITGFSIDPVTGLGLLEPANFKVFQPFFVKTNLPYSVKRGEIMSLSLTVFNYMAENLDVDVTLHNEEKEFKFVDISNDINEQYLEMAEDQMTKQVSVKSNSGKSVSFMITPTKIGYITLKISAMTGTAGDRIEKKLLVEAEGVTEYVNKAFFVDLTNSSDFTTNIKIDVPADAVPDSTKIEASVIGDVLGPTLKNLDQLIRLPSGCGEQNMLNFVPNIVVLDYLTAVDQLTPELEKKSKNFMETGYQKELTYKHSDGSYSAFGSGTGSTWLTAFVAKSFNQASKYIMVDQEIISQALRFLSQQQTIDGKFEENGKILAQSMQGGAGKGVGLTAYTLITFLENKDHRTEYETVIKNALDFIETNIDSLNDTYSLAITSYALQLADHPKKDLVLEKLNQKSVEKDGMKFWEKEKEEKVDKESEITPFFIRYSKPDSVNIEMTAYALLAYVEANLQKEALPIMKWLIAQRNEKGGFQSTQDTVVGLQALAKIIQKVYVADTNVRVSFGYGEQESLISVNNDNSLVLQKHEIPSNFDSIKLKAFGQGIVLAQVSYKFNIDKVHSKKWFDIKHTLDSNSDIDKIALTVCTKFLPDTSVKVSNMAVMELQFPSGFSYDHDSSTSLKNIKKFRKKETKHDDTVVILYFDSIGEQEICPTLSALRVQKVANQKPASILVYDYYETTRRSTVFYESQQADVCDICSDCEKICADRKSRQASEN